MPMPNASKKYVIATALAVFVGICALFATQTSPRPMFHNLRKRPEMGLFKKWYISPVPLNDAYGIRSFVDYPLNVVVVVKTGERGIAVNPEMQRDECYLRLTDGREFALGKPHDMAILIHSTGVQESWPLTPGRAGRLFEMMRGADRLADALAQLLGMESSDAK